MMTRRQFMLAMAALASMPALGMTKANTVDDNKNNWLMPDEADQHKRTWMAFVADEEIWGEKLVSEVHRNLATIANTIAKYEPVSMLVNEDDYALAKSLVGPNVALVVAETDDLWMRDTGPVFVKNGKGKIAAVDFNFNGWGNKQVHDNDAEVAEFIAEQADVDTLHTKLVLEGGGIEVDGNGTAIITESCVLNANRNPGLTKKQCEAELNKLLGIEKVIWLPGIKGKDITDGHTDFYARFASPGVVVAGLETDPDIYDHAVTLKHLAILRAATDAKGRKLKVVVIEGPSKIRPRFESDDFAAGYINFYVCNGAVIAPEFGDAKADATAKEKLKALFPTREIVQINIDGIAAGGGGIHCTTQQEPQPTRIPSQHEPKV